MFRLYIEEHLTPNRSEHAVRSAKRVRRFISIGLGRQRVGDSKPSDIRTALQKFRQTPGNYNLVRAYVASAWNWGRKFGYLQETLGSPVEDIEALPSTPRSRRITEAEYPSAFAAISIMMAERRNDPARLLACAFVIATGCRPIEAVRLRRDHVYRERGEAILTEHKTFQRTGQPKVFHLTPLVLDILDRADALHTMRAVGSEFCFSPTRASESIELASQDVEFRPKTRRFGYRTQTIPVRLYQSCR